MAGKLYIMFTLLQLKKKKQADEQNQKLLLFSHTQIESLGFNFSSTNKTYLALYVAGQKL